MKPLISIIVPNFKRSTCFSETPQSLLGQTYLNLECIVVDIGSTENTLEVLLPYCKQDTRIQYFKRRANRTKLGNACRNYGVELSKGHYINWFDSDNIILPEYILTW